MRYTYKHKKNKKKGGMHALEPLNEVDNIKLEIQTMKETYEHKIRQLEEDVSRLSTLYPIVQNMNNSMFIPLCVESLLFVPTTVVDLNTTLLKKLIVVPKLTYTFVLRRFLLLPNLKRVQMSIFTDDSCYKSRDISAIINEEDDISHPLCLYTGGPMGIAPSQYSTMSEVANPHGKYSYHMVFTFFKENGIELYDENNNPMIL